MLFLILSTIVFLTGCSKLEEQNNIDDIAAPTSPIKIKLEVSKFLRWAKLLHLTQLSQ
jgi:hypothetical protein